MGTKYFDFTYLAPSQEQPEVPINADLDAIDEALNNAGIGSISVKQVGDSPEGDAIAVREIHFSGGVTVTPQTNGVALVEITGSSSSDTESDHSSDTGGSPLSVTFGDTTVDNVTQIIVDGSAVVSLTDEGGGVVSLELAADFTSDNGGTGGGDFWSPDIPPDEANAMDDEFNGTELDGKWSLLQGTGLTTTFDGHACTIAIPSDGGVDTRTWRGISQELPSGNWRFRIKVLKVSIATNYNFVGFFLVDSASKNGTSWGIDWHSSYGQPCFFAADTSDYTGHTMGDLANVGAAAWTTWALLYFNAIRSFYLDLEYDGTNLNLYGSFDGINFGVILTHAASVEALPDTIALGGEAISSASGCSMTVDYFRRIA